MRPLDKLLPPLELLLAMEPEELAGKLLFVLREVALESPQRMVIRGNFSGGLTSSQSPYLIEKRDDVMTAITEAWSWLEAQGLLVPALGMSGEQGWRVPSRRARQFEDEREFSLYSASRYLRKEALHSVIATVRKPWG
jgi:hypothetical protein